MTPPKVGDTVRVEDLSSYKDPPYTPFYAEVLTIDNTAMITVERRGKIWEAYAFEYLTKEQEMANKEYLETTFPDGTPVKIYPVKDNQQALIQSAFIDKLRSLCKQVLEAKCPEGAEYAVGTFHSCPFCENTSTNAYNTDIDLIEHEEDCAYNIAKDLLDDKERTNTGS